MEQFEFLLSPIITSVLHTPSKSHIKFCTSKGDLIIFAHGDCCSRSWFESFEGLENLIGEGILAIVTKEEREDRKESLYGDEVIAYYGFTFKTAKGLADLEMRNSSNGYYGGKISIKPDYNYEEPDEKFIPYLIKIEDANFFYKKLVEKK